MSDYSFGTNAKGFGDTKNEKRERISRTYMSGRYEECLALVIDQMKDLAEDFVYPEKKDGGSMFGISRAGTSSKTSGNSKMRLMHKCCRREDCDCADLLVFYFSLLHLTS